MTAFVICSRLSSSRLPNKALQKYNGITHLEHLLKRLNKTELPIYLAVPESEAIHYSSVIESLPFKVHLFTGFEDDPLKRMYECAKKNKIENIIRVTHDKIFIDIESIHKMIDDFIVNKFDYIYSSQFIPGTGFEIISFEALENASKQFIRVEHVSYAIKSVTKNILNYNLKKSTPDIRLLIDYPADVQLMNVIFATLGTDCDLFQVIRFLETNQTLKNINKMPTVTIYTCALNAQKWIQECMGSVSIQDGFKDYEYLLIDDFSTDRTLFHMAKFCQTYKNSRFIRNDKNLGLSSSSNIALKNARGKYIIRIDADDFFIGKNVIKNMISEIEANDFDVVYPNCFVGLSRKVIQKGSDKHHVGGTLFNTSAINYIKFTDALMNYDSLDIFLRSKNKLKIGYHDKTTFCYRQHNESMSKSNLEDREKTRKIIEEKYK